MKRAACVARTDYLSTQQQRTNDETTQRHTHKHKNTHIALLETGAKRGKESGSRGRRQDEDLQMGSARLGAVIG